MRPNLLIIYDNPPSFGGRSFWSTKKEFEENRLWINQEAHKIISLPVIREKVVSVSEVFTYAFEDVRFFSPSLGYLCNDHPDYTQHTLCHVIENVVPDIIIVAGRKFVGTLVERYCSRSSKRLARKVQVVKVPHPLRCGALHPYEVNDILRRIEDALRLCTNACYTGST